MRKEKTSLADFVRHNVPRTWERRWIAKEVTGCEWLYRQRETVDGTVIA